MSRRYSVGVTPVVALKARLKGPSDWKPASIAIVITGTSAWLGIGERGLGFGDPVLVEEDIEVAVAEPLVDQPPQPVFGDGELGRQRADGDVVVAIDAFVAHQPHQRVDELLIGTGFDDRHVAGSA